MSTETLPRTDLDSDVACAVDALFEELDCDSEQKDKLPCGGQIMGFREHHDCRQGWLCENHWKHAIDHMVPLYKAKLEKHGFIGCIYCHKMFEDLRKYVRHYPKDPK